MTHLAQNDLFSNEFNSAVIIIFTRDVMSSWVCAYMRADTHICAHICIYARIYAYMRTYVLHIFVTLFTCVGLQSFISVTISGLQRVAKGYSHPSDLNWHP